SRILSYTLGGTFLDPLNIMCSKKCEIPVMPGRSLREPTLYHCQNVTAGTAWSSCSSTTRPFASLWRSTGNETTDNALCGGGAGAVRAARAPYDVHASARTSAATKRM